VVARFPTTRWTIVSAAGCHSLDSAGALNELCGAYWFPVYAFIRRRGYSPEAAEDLSQEFFARVLEHDTLSGARRERGKFRSFLLASLTNFLSNEWDRSQAQKRGGGMTTLSLDFGAGEARYHHEPCHDITPEALFERRWAIAVLDRVLARLREEHSHKGQAAQFDRLQVFLTGDQDHGSYDDVARSLKLSEGAVRTTVHRLRRRYGELVREEIEGIVGDPGEVEGEIRFLLAALGHE
jgi:RNA polymerase sigma factor (sigma-70 family)